MTEADFFEIKREVVVQLLTDMWDENQRLHAQIRTKDTELTALATDLHSTKTRLEHISAGIGYVTALIDMAARIVKVADRVDAEDLEVVPCDDLADVFQQAKTWATETGQRQR